MNANNSTSSWNVREVDLFQDLLKPIKTRDSFLTVLYKFLTTTEAMVCITNMVIVFLLHYFILRIFGRVYHNATTGYDEVVYDVDTEFVGGNETDSSDGKEYTPDASDEEYESEDDPDVSYDHSD